MTSSGSVEVIPRELILAEQLYNAKKEKNHTLKGI
jgi:hypothetical protein